MKVKEYKEKRGGRREGAGRKPLYPEVTKQVGFRCPVSKEEEFKKAATRILAKWQI